MCTSKPGRAAGSRLERGEDGVEQSREIPYMKKGSDEQRLGLGWEAILIAVLNSDIPFTGPILNHAD